MKTFDLPCGVHCGPDMVKTTLRTLAERLPEDVRIPMLLGLEGDCDFSRSLTDFLPHNCGKDELLALIDRETEQDLTPVCGLPGFAVLCRRHAVWVPGLMLNEAAED